MTLTAHNNVTLPEFMYGTAWKKDATARLVEMAVEAGFTAIDTANQLIHYQEEYVGDALLELQKKGVSRDNLFLQTKFTPVNGQDHRTPYDAKAPVSTQVKQSMDSSLKHLHTEHVDSYVLHGPYSRGGLIAEDWEVWQTMEELLQAGKTRMIGISNVTAGQLKQLCANSKVKPMVVQNRCYASAGWDRDVRQICQQENIVYQGFSLLTANPHVVGSAETRAIAKRLQTGPAQVIFRFSMQIGMLPLTGTCNQQHMKEDLEAINLELSNEDMRLLESAGAPAR